MRRILFAMFVIAAQNAYAAEPFCESGETALFSCNTGKKLIALCASDNLSKEKGYVQYRVTHNGKKQFVYPSENTHPSGFFFESTMLWTKDDEQRVHFRNGDFSYLLYDRSFSAYPKDSRAGVMVFRNGKKVSDLQCKENMNPLKRAFSIWISEREGPFEHKDFLY